MIFHSTSQGKGNTPTKTHEKPSQNVPRKFLGRWVRRGRPVPSCPSFAKPTDFPFAPGVIEGFETDHQVEGWSVPWGLALLALCALILVLSFTSGYLNLPARLF